MEKIVALWRKHLEEEVDETRLANIWYSECVSFSCDARVPRASLYRRKPRRAKRVVDSPSTPVARRPLQLKDATYEWVDYSAPSVCLEEEEDGVCLREEPTPCSDDPNALVCSIDTRQLPQKRKRNPWVSVCIDDMGVDYYMSRRAVRLRPAVTLSYLPYGPEVREQARAAAAAGHELMVHLPMEPFNKAADAGPNALHSSMTQEQLRQHLHWALSQFDGYVGLNNHMGSLFTSRFHDGMRVVLEELRRRDLFFLDSLTANDSLGQELAAHLGTTFGARDVFLDSQRDDVAAVEARLAEVEQLALKNGHAIAIGHPYVATLEALERWLPLLHAKGLRLMPLKKALLRERKERERLAGEAVLAFTRSKQLRAVQAVRERESRERHARAVASELEAAFGDGTVLGWQGLQDAAAVTALRLVLEKRRQVPNGLRASLQRLLSLTPFQGGRGPRGPHVEKAAVRLLRRRAMAGRLADLVAPAAGAYSAQAVGQPWQRKEVGVRKRSMGSNRRGVQWGSRGDPRGLMGLLGEEEGQGVPEEVQPQEGPCGGKEGEPSEAAEGASAAEIRPLLSSRRGKDEIGRRRKARTGQKVRTMQISEWEDSAVQVAMQSGHGTEGVQDLPLGASDQPHGTRVSVLLAGEGAVKAESKDWSSKQEGGDVSPAGEVRKKPSSWQHGAGSTLAMRRWLAGSTARELSVENDSPRTVLAVEQFEAAADASSQEDSPVGHAALSLSSEGSEVAVEAVASERAWSPEHSSSSSRSSSRRSLGSVSEGSSADIGRQTEEQSRDTACRWIVTAATGLALALQLSMLARKVPWVGIPEAQTTTTAATMPMAEAVVLEKPPNVTTALPAVSEKAEDSVGSPDKITVAAQVPETALAAPAALPTRAKESHEEAAPNRAVEVPAAMPDGEQEVLRLDDAPAGSAAVTAEPAALESGGEGGEEETAPASSPIAAVEVPSSAMSPSCTPAHPSCSAVAGLQVEDREERDASTDTALVRPAVDVWPVEKKARDAPAGLLALVQADDGVGHRRRPLVPWQHAVSPTRGTESLLGRALEAAAGMEEAPEARGSEQQRAGAEEDEGGAGNGLPLYEAVADEEAGVLEGVDAHAKEGPHVDSAQRASSLPRDIPRPPHANPDDDLLWWDAEAKSLTSARSSPASWGEPTLAALARTPHSRINQTAGDEKAGPGLRAGQLSGHVGAAEGAFLGGQKGDGSKKKYGWWRWTVGCVLGGMDEAGEGEGEDVGKGRAGGHRGSRRVVPLNFDDEEGG